MGGQSRTFEGGQQGLRESSQNTVESASKRDCEMKSTYTIHIPKKALSRVALSAVREASASPGSVPRSLATTVLCSWDLPCV